MKIGITYDLKSDYIKMGLSPEEAAEFDSEETIDAIDASLSELGFQTERIGGIYSLLKMLNKGAGWDMVFNIAEGYNGSGRETQVPAILDAFGIPYTFSEPTVLAATHEKAIAKRIVKSFGIPTADFKIIEDADDLYSVDLPFPLFAKPVAEGTSKGIDSESLINDRESLNRTCIKLLEKFNQPVLVERYLPGREFTVGITGTGKKAEVIGVLEINLISGQDAGYSYESKQMFEDRVRYTLAEDNLSYKAADVALRSYRALGCRDCGRVDLRCDAEGSPCFIELNPLAGLNPSISDLPILCRMKGISYLELIDRIMKSALERNKTENRLGKGLEKIIRGMKPLVFPPELIGLTGGGNENSSYS